MTLGDAFRVALEMRGQFFSEAAHVAAERAEACQDHGDAAGSDWWNRVYAMITHLDRGDLQTRH
jgi:hypothetical protein